MDKIERRFTNIEASLKSLGETIDEHFKRGFQKGKLEQKKEDIKIIKDFFDYHIEKDVLLNVEKRILLKAKEQLSKEIGGIEE